MSSRDNILHRIRTALSAAPAVAPPPVPEVWPKTTCDPIVLAERFTEELKAVHGETIHCATMDDARRELRRLMDEGPWPVVGAVDRPLCRELTAGLPSERVAWTKPECAPREMAQLPVGLVAAEYLLADTGSSVIACHTAPERLMCYLPPACVVIGRASQLAEHLPAAWERIARQCADPSARGEFVVVTGPSRTADIEKILILGVHGPKRLVVLLVSD